jgi:hypothetical protein
MSANLILFLSKADTRDQIMALAGKDQANNAKGFFLEVQSFYCASGRCKEAFLEGGGHS